MRRLFLSGLMVLAFSVTAFAGVDVSKLQLPGDITQAQADTVIKGALAKAKEQGVPMNIAVVDAGGNLKAFTRMDGAFLGSIDISIGKARTARLFNMPTSALGAASQPGKELYGIEVTNNGLVIFGGGELLKNKDGVIVGAVGVSGGIAAYKHRKEIERTLQEIADQMDAWEDSGDFFGEKDTIVHTVPPAEEAPAAEEEQEAATDSDFVDEPTQDEAPEEKPEA